MKAFQLLVLTFFIFIGVSCEKEDTKEEVEDTNFQVQQLVGSWTGTINQAGYGEFNGTVMITQIKEGEQVATGSYDNPVCNFSWIYKGQSADKKNYIFKESISEEFSDCAPGTVHLRFKDKDNLYYDWIGDDAPAFNFANGILERE